MRGGKRLEEKMENKIVRTGYVSGLDGLRGLAIALVLFSHSVTYDEFSYFGASGLEAGYAGVAIFFVLSGYLITKLLLREEAESGNISLRLFYIRRVLRLFPALWLYLLILGILCAGGYLPDNPWHSFVSSLLYVRNLVGRGHETTHLWSLSIEEQFYIVWPLLFISLHRRNSARLAVAAILLIVINGWRYIAALNGWASFGALYLRSDFRFDAPLAGCLLAIVEFNHPRLFSGLRSGTWITISCFLTGLLCLLGWIILSVENAFCYAIGPTVFAVSGILLILSQIGRQSYITGLIASKPAIALGKISYGLYLWQQLFLGPKIEGFGIIRSFPLGLICTFIVALLSYYFLELPLLRLKDQKFHKPRQREISNEGVETGKHL